VLTKVSVLVLHSEMHVLYSVVFIVVYVLGRGILQLLAILILSTLYSVIQQEKVTELKTLSPVSTL